MLIPGSSQPHTSATCAGQLAECSQHALDIGQFPLQTGAPARRHPDLNGYWQSLVSADWDLQDTKHNRPKPEINGVYGAGRRTKHRRGGEIPYVRSAGEKKKTLKRARWWTSAMIRLGTRLATRR